MTTYIYDAKRGKVVERRERQSRRSLEIISDIQPYRSMVDGSRISSRSHHRDHLRAHGVIEVGNEKMETKRQPLDRARRRAAIAESMGDMTDSQAEEIMSQLERQSRR